MPGKVGYNPLDMVNVNAFARGGNEPLAVFVGSLVAVVPCRS